MSSWSCLSELSFVSLFVFVYIIVFIFVTIFVFISHLSEHPRLTELLKAGRCVAQNSQGGRLRAHYHDGDGDAEENESFSDLQLKTLRVAAFVHMYTHIIIMMVVKGVMMRKMKVTYG